jgi:hypothetical protein
MVAVRRAAMPWTGRRAMFVAVLVGILASLETALPALGADAVLVTFTSGTGDSSGSLTVTNASTGSTTTSGLAPHSPPAACANALSLAAPKVGFRTELSGSSVRIFGRGALVKVVGATINKSDAAADGGS